MLYARRAILLSAAFAALALAGCASMGPGAAFDPAACTTREMNIYFEEWQTDLNDEAKATLDATQQSLRGCRIDHVRILGMADASGTQDANLDVSAQRTETIANALAARGWPRGSFELLAAGESGATVGELDRPLRRRAQITIQASPP